MADVKTLGQPPKCDMGEFWLPRIVSLESKIHEIRVSCVNAYSIDGQTLTLTVLANHSLPQANHASR